MFLLGNPCRGIPGVCHLLSNDSVRIKVLVHLERERERREKIWQHIETNWIEVMAIIPLTFGQSKNLQKGSVLPTRRIG